MSAKKIVVLVVVLTLLAGAVSFVIWVRNHGFSAREKPSWIETVLARRARNLAMPAGATELKNPSPATESNIAEARDHFVEHCSVCHGAAGHGDTLYGRNLYPKVPDLTQADTQRLTDGELFYIISNGVRFTGMPAFGGEDSPESIWGLVSFIRRLPKLTPEEIRQLRKMAELRGTETDEKSEPTSGATDKTKRGEPAGAEKGKEPKQRSHGPGTKPNGH
jgi:mono/diheme cytochrome c family protein